MSINLNSDAGAIFILGYITAHALIFAFVFIVKIMQTNRQLDALRNPKGMAE